jgi:hypothetical protein
MTRSIFDPGGGETERSGSRFGPEDADNRSRVPPDVVDGEVSSQEVADALAADEADAKGLDPEQRIAAMPGDAADLNPEP